MAISFEMRFVGGTLEQYDKVIQMMGFKPRGKGADHAYFHWIAKTSDGFVVVDTWENQAEFDKFAQAQIGPLTQKVGLAPPKVTAYEVHNYLVGGMAK